MEKISGILPEKPRLRAEKEPLPPVRPGAPAFGRAEGSSEIRDRVTLSSMKNIGPQEFQNYKNPKEAKHVKIVEDLSRKFFMSPAQPSNSNLNSNSAQMPIQFEEERTPQRGTKDLVPSKPEYNQTIKQLGAELIPEYTPSSAEIQLEQN